MAPVVVSVCTIGFVSMDRHGLFCTAFLNGTVSVDSKTWIEWHFLASLLSWRSLMNGTVKTQILPLTVPFIPLLSRLFSANHRRTRHDMEPVRNWLAQPGLERHQEPPLFLPVSGCKRVWHCVSLSL